jgi:hypothetical protein
MCSADTQEVSASDVTLDYGTKEAVHVGMEQLVQTAVGVEPLVVELRTTMMLLEQGAAG